MARRLLERNDELDVLLAAVAAARGSRGSVVLVSGVTGVGKTSLIRAFTKRVGGSVRVLQGACDDLTAPRAAGPLRDAVRHTPGPLATALADATRPEAVGPALLDELSVRTPTVLVVEDLQWADDTTLDLLRYAARRVERVGAVLVLTTCDDDTGGVARMWPFREALIDCPVRHLPLAPLSRAAVASLAARAGRSPARLYEVTGGNPFLVTALLRAEPEALPPAVTDAVLARVHRLSRRCRVALAQLSVMPALVPFDFADALLGSGLDALIEAELAGLVEVTRDGVAVRPELVRRVIEQSMPRLRRRRMHQVVVDTLRAQPCPQLARVVHHAVLANDLQALVEVAPAAALEAGAAGAPGRASTLLEPALPHLGRLGADERTAMLDSWARRMHELVTVGEPDRAVALLEPGRRLADASGQPGFAAIYCLYGGAAEAVTAPRGHGEVLLRKGIAAAADAGQGEHAATGYTLLAELLYRENRFVELEDCLREGLAFTDAPSSRDALATQRQHLQVHHYVLLLRRGDVVTADEGLRTLADQQAVSDYAEPWLARLAARRGDQAAHAVLSKAWRRAGRHRRLTPLTYTGIAYLEWAWLSGDWDTAREVAEVLLPHLSRPGTAGPRAEALCQLARAGIVIEAFPGCPEPYASSLRRDRQAAAQAWRALGDPYEAALELGLSGEPAAVQQAVRLLDGLGATAVARLVQARLRATGARTPRGPRRQTRNNPAGLTNQQLNVLRLLCAGLTNAEIAARLVLSVRTVDHHVAAILRKLGVPSRRAAAAMALALGI